MNRVSVPLNAMFPHAPQPYYGGRLAAFCIPQPFSTLHPSNMPVKTLMKYRDARGRVLFVAVTAWGSGKYAVFSVDEKGRQKRLVEKDLPPRRELRAAQKDLDGYAERMQLEKVAD
jgi:hypothetical protein